MLWERGDKRARRSRSAVTTSLMTSRWFTTQLTRCHYETQR